MTAALRILCQVKSNPTHPGTLILLESLGSGELSQPLSPEHSVFAAILPSSLGLSVSTPFPNDAPNSRAVWRSFLESQFSPGFSTLGSSNVVMVIAAQPGDARPKGKGKSRAHTRVLRKAGTRGRPRVGLRAGSACGQAGGGRAEAARGQQSAGCGAMLGPGRGSCVPGSERCSLLGG